MTSHRSAKELADCVRAERNSVAGQSDLAIFTMAECDEIIAALETAPAAEPTEDEIACVSDAMLDAIFDQNGSINFKIQPVARAAIAAMRRREDDEAQVVEIVARYFCRRHNGPDWNWAAYCNDAHLALKTEGATWLTPLPSGSKGGEG